MVVQSYFKPNYYCQYWPSLYSKTSQCIQLLTFLPEKLCLDLVIDMQAEPNYDMCYYVARYAIYVHSITSVFFAQCSQCTLLLYSHISITSIKSEIIITNWKVVKLVLLNVALELHVMRGK